MAIPPTTEWDRTVTASSTTGQIVAFNTLLSGISQDENLPTVLLRLHGMPPAETEAAVAAVGMLQTVAPSFRVVLFTDFPIFAAVKSFGWPVEHVMPVEHHARIAGTPQHRIYVERRIAIAERHYRDVVVVHADGAVSATENIAALIGRPDLAAVARRLTTTASVHSEIVSRWDAVEEGLRDNGTANFASAEGRARISVVGAPHGSALITGGSPVGFHSVDRHAPDWLCWVQVDFDVQSTLALEAFVYASLSRSLGRTLAVVLPWRQAAVLSSDVLYWADLAVEDSVSGLQVIRQYSETYEVMTDSPLLDWHEARRYASARRLSRTAAGTRGGPQQTATS